MRKLVYVGYNKEFDEGIETTSFDTMNRYKKLGFVFKMRLDTIVERTEPNERIKQIMKHHVEKIRKG